MRNSPFPPNRQPKLGVRKTQRKAGRSVRRLGAVRIFGRRHVAFGRYAVLTHVSVGAAHGGARVVGRDLGLVGKRSGFCVAVPGGCVQELLERSLPDWQSEFLAVGAIVVLSIFLRQDRSPESKPVTASNSETGS